MRKTLRISSVILALIVLLIVCAAIYVKSFLPDVGPARNIKIVSTTAKVERGKYLSNHVTICMDCHSTRDWQYFAAPVKPGSLGKGGEPFNHDMGFPGSFYASNITPAGIGDWTDGEVFRAITTGVRKNGQPIFPVMPHVNYGTLDPEDIESIICYLRTLPAIENKIPVSEYDFPMNFIINTIPAKASLSRRPDTSDTLAYGKYIVTAAACRDCHTPFDQGAYNTSLYFAGGRVFNLPSGAVTTVNLTPDPETGTGSWSKEFFIDKFRKYRNETDSHRKINIKTDFSTIMPWSMYAGMTDLDLAAIYSYLHSLAPIKNANVKFLPNKLQ